MKERPRNRGMEANIFKEEVGKEKRREGGKEGGEEV